MDGKELIINNIIASAENSAAGIIADANAEKDASLEKLRNELSFLRAEAIANAELSAVEYSKRRQTLSALDERKAILQAKQMVLDSVYHQVGSKILNMIDNIYRDFMGGIVAKYAEDGDMIEVTERDSKRLNGDWVDSLTKKLKLRLTLLSDHPEGRGGLVLIGKKYDKNLLLDNMLNDLRAATEGEVAKRLFTSSVPRA